MKYDFIVYLDLQFININSISVLLKSRERTSSFCPFAKVYNVLMYIATELRPRRCLEITQMMHLFHFWTLATSPQ